MKAQNSQAIFKVYLYSNNNFLADYIYWQTTLDFHTRSRFQLISSHFQTSQLHASIHQGSWDFQRSSPLIWCSHQLQIQWHLNPVQAIEFNCWPSICYTTCKLGKISNSLFWSLWLPYGIHRESVGYEAHSFVIHCLRAKLPCSIWWSSLWCTYLLLYSRSGTSLFVNNHWLWNTLSLVNEHYATSILWFLGPSPYLSSRCHTISFRRVSNSIWFLAILHLLFSSSFEQTFSECFYGWLEFVWLNSQSSCL